MRGLNPDVKWELLKQDPPTFATACQMAEHLACFGNCDQSMSSKQYQKPKPKKQHNNKNPYHQGGFLPTEVQISLLDYLQANGNCGQHRINIATATGLTIAHCTTAIITPSEGIKTTTQSHATSVEKLVTQRGNAIIIQPTSVVVLFGAGINVADSSLGLTLANKMAN